VSSAKDRMRNNRIVFSWLLLTAASCSAPQGIESVSSQTVWVYKYSGAIQCGAKGVPLDVMEKMLTANDIEVLSSCRTGDGSAHPFACGLPAGSINAYEIDARNLHKAISLEFGEVSRIPGYKGLPFKEMLGSGCFKD